MEIEEIWAEYQSGIKRYLHSKISNPADVDDVLQDILIKTHQSLENLESRDSVKSWIFTIAHNAITDFYRKNGKHRDLQADDLWYEDQEEDEHAFAQCVQPFINALPQKTAALLTAIDLDGQSQKDYAAQHDISYSTLKSRVQNGRQQLQDLFRDCCNMSVDRRGNIIDYEVKTGKHDPC